MRPTLALRVGTQLSMTPQMQQAIRLMQLSALELDLEIREAIETNPMLEMVEDGEDEGDGLSGVLERNPDYWPKAQYDYPRVDCAGPGQLLELAEELFRRQHTNQDVAAIMGGNFMRVAEAVWK